MSYEFLFFNKIEFSFRYYCKMPPLDNDDLLVYIFHFCHPFCRSIRAVSTRWKLIYEKQFATHVRFDITLNPAAQYIPFPCVNLNISGCSYITSLEPLAGVVKILHMNNCHGVVSLEPLRGAIHTLIMRYCWEIISLAPIVKTIHVLDMTGCYRVKSLNDFNEITSPIEILIMALCRRIKSLKPLRDTNLKKLNMNGCMNIREIYPVGKLEYLDIFMCPGIASLEPVRGTIKKLYICGISHIKTLEPIFDTIEKLEIYHYKEILINEIDALRKMGVKINESRYLN